jgi:hypothetical protein
MSLDSAKAAFVSASNELVQVHETFRVNLAAAVAALGEAETTLNLDLADSSAKAAFVDAANGVVTAQEYFRLALSAAIATLGQAQTDLHAAGGT